MINRPRLRNAVEGSGVVQVLGNWLFMCQMWPLVFTDDAAGRESDKAWSNGIFGLTHFVRASLCRKVHKQAIFSDSMDRAGRETITRNLITPVFSASPTLYCWLHAAEIIVLVEFRLVAATFEELRIGNCLRFFSKAWQTLVRRNLL